MSRVSAHRDRCRASGKHRFRDHREASRALRSAATARHFAEQDGVTTCRREVRAYECSACKGWHLTSWAEPSGPRVDLAFPPQRTVGPIDDMARAVRPVAGQLGRRTSSA